VKGRDKLRHRGHRDPARHDDADDGPDRDRRQNFTQCDEVDHRRIVGRNTRRRSETIERHMGDQRRDDRNRHADHAETVAAP